MNGGWELALVFQSCMTAAASGFNAFQFLVYPTKQRRRRWGALTLMVISLAFLVQSLYLGIVPWVAAEAGELLVEPKPRFLAGVLPLLASLLVLSFVIVGLRRR